MRRVLLCSGKVYYDLAAARTERERDDVAILRVEQLYPLPADAISAELAKYPDAELVWVQEEPANQGGWPFMALNLPEHLGGRPLLRVTRRAVGVPRRRLARACTRRSSARSSTPPSPEAAVYFTDRGIEELVERRGEEQVSLEWLAGRLQAFVDEHPEFETAVERLATWLARDDEDD